MGEAPWTTRRLREWTGSYLQSQGIESARACADLLVAHALGMGRMGLYTDPERPASPSERDRLREMVRRAGAHEPVQYIVGAWGFLSHEFRVSPATLIPRPSTESLAAEGIRMLRERPAWSRILDIGTGTGCIGLSLAKSMLAMRRECALVATDIVAEALDCARANAESLGVAACAQFRQGSLLDPLRARDDAPFDLICANPPYIDDKAWESLPRNVREWEPATALRGGADGLRVVEPLLRGAPPWMAPGGALLVEIGFDQREAALAIAAAVPGLCNPEVLKDDEGNWRILRAWRG